MDPKAFEEMVRAYAKSMELSGSQATMDELYAQNVSAEILRDQLRETLKNLESQIATIECEIAERKAKICRLAKPSL